MVFYNPPSARFKHIAMKHQVLYFALSMILLLLPSAISTGWGQESLPKPRDIYGEDFITKDGVRLVGTFYASTIGKDAVPVLIIQDWNEDRHSVQPMAIALQKMGCAVLAIDVRGQGDSTKQIGPNGQEITLDKLRVTQKVAEDMVKIDIELFRKYLIKQNDNGTLNIQKLCLVGIGSMGSYLATAYASIDAAWGALGQGGDVKALALISPRLKNGVLSYKTTFTPGLRNIATFIWFGKDDPAAANDAKSITNLFGQQRPGETKLKPADRTLFSVGLDTKLQGLKLLGTDDPKMEKNLEKFIEVKLQNKEIFWKQKNKD